MRTLPFKQVDVFTRTPFTGNPVAVVLDARTLDSEAMQRIAAWTNLSETTFVLPPSSPDADYRLRIFTPKQELPFAGHPTIGSAHAVLESGIATPRNRRLRQECLAGIVELDIDETGSDRRIFVSAPQPRISALDHDQTQRLANALGLGGDHTLSFLRVDIGVVWIVGDLDSADRVAALSPALDEVRRLSAETGSAGVTLFGKTSDSRCRIHVRSFAPLLGIAEDPVCGSGNASVAAYLLHSDALRQIGADYIARQGMEVGRNGEVAVNVAAGVIRFGGYAVTCIEGSLRFD